MSDAPPVPAVVELATAFLLRLGGPSCAPAPPASGRPEAPRKPRVRIAADGRMGWPDVVQYEICERRSPTTGELLPNPPGRDVYGHCLVHSTGVMAVVPPLDGAPYLVRVIDPAEHARLEAAGWLTGPPHLAPREEAIDNRHDLEQRRRKARPGDRPAGASA